MLLVVFSAEPPVTCRKNVSQTILPWSIWLQEVFTSWGGCAGISPSSSIHVFLWEPCHLSCRSPRPCHLLVRTGPNMAGRIKNEARIKGQKVRHENATLQALRRDP